MSIISRGLRHGAAISALACLKACDRQPSLRQGIAEHPFGWVDTYLLASACFAGRTPPYTRDRRLRGIADELGLGMAPGRAA